MNDQFNLSVADAREFVVVGIFDYVVGIVKMSLEVF